MRCLAPVLVVTLLCGTPTAVAEDVRTDRLGDPLPTAASVRFGTLRFRTPRRSVALAVSPDRRQLASATAEGVVEIWDTTTGRIVHQLSPPPREDEEDKTSTHHFSDVQFAPKSNAVAACADGRVFIWDLDPVQARDPLVVDDRLLALTWAPDETSILAGGANKEIHVWSLDSGQISLRLPGHTSEISDLAVGARGKLLLSVGRGGKLLSFSTSGFGAGKLTADHGSALEAVATSSNGKLAAVGDAEGNIMLWDLKRRQVTQRIAASTSAIDDIEFYDKGRRLVAVAGGELHLFDTKGSRKGRFSSPSSVAVAFADELFVGGQHLESWDADSGTNLFGEVGHTGPVRAVAFTNGGSFVASGGESDALKVWETATGHELQSLPGHGSILALKATREGSQVVAGGRSRDVHVWNILNGKEQARLSGHTGPVTAVAFSPTADRVASGGADHSVRVWNLASGKVERTFFGDGGHVRSMAWSPKGRLLAAGLDRRWFRGSSESIVVWHVGNGSRQYRISLASAAIDLVFSPDGQRMAVAGADGVIRIYDTNSAEETMVLSGHTGHVRALSWSENTGMLASGGSDKTVRIWSTDDGKELRQFTGHLSAVYAVAFDPAGSKLVSASADSTVLVWELKPRDPGSGSQ